MFNAECKLKMNPEILTLIQVFFFLIKKGSYKMFNMNL